MTNSAQSRTVLIVAPDERDSDLHLDAIRGDDLDVRIVGTGRAAVKHTRESTVVCIVVTGELPEMNPGQFRSLLPNGRPEIPVLFTEAVDPDTLDAMKGSTPFRYVPEARLAEAVASVVQDRRVDEALGDRRALSDAIRRIARDVSEASSREAIDRAVHRHLERLDKFRLVWLAEPNDRDGAITLRHPTSGRIEPTALAASGEDDGASLFSRAVTDGAVAVGDHATITRGTTTSPDTGATNPADRHRTASITTAVVPLVHDETVYECLLAQTAPGTTLDDVDEDLLAELGRIAGAGIERIESSGLDPDQFASILSHDLRNPLNVAAGQIEMANEEIDDDRLDTAAAALDRMSELIEDVRTLARTGQTVEETEPVDLATEVERCWKTAGSDGATLVTETNHVVQADPGRLRQLLENLFRNAIEHGSTGSRAEGDGIETDSVESDESGTESVPGDDAGRESTERPGESGDGARGTEDVTVTVGDVEDGFYVADDGPGIPQDEREQVFETGYSSVADGTGLGLSIVEQIAAAHDWTVRAAESEDHGARFEITGVELHDSNSS